MSKLINVGLGNVVNAERIIAIVSPESAPVKRLINEMIEDLVYIQEEETQIILKMLNIFSTATTNAEVEKKFNNLMKRNKINLTFDQVITNKNSKELGDMIKEAKKKNRKKK